MGSSPPAAAPHRDTASRPGQHLRGRRDVLLRCLSGCGSSSTRLADLCFCADSPRSSGRLCRAGLPPSHSQDKGGVSWSPRQQEQELSFHLSAQTLPLQPREPCTCLLHWPLPHTRAAVPLAPGTQGGQRADPTLREEKGSSARSPSAQHRAALSSISRSHRDEGQSSAATTCQTPALGCLLMCISRSDMYQLSRVIRCTSLTVPTQWHVIVLGGLLSLTIT